MMDGWMAIFYSTVLLVGVSLKPKINFNLFENKAHPLGHSNPLQLNPPAAHET